MLTWPKKTITVTDHDPRWAERFEEERALLLALDPPVVSEVHHIGSTAVPGLGAKPIVDVAAVYLAYPGPAAREALRAIGWVHERSLGDPEVLFLAKGDHEAHLQLLPGGSTRLANHLAFRDYLREHPAECAAYVALKRELAERFGDDGRGYTLGKHDLVVSLLERARAAKGW